MPLSSPPPGMFSRTQPDSWQSNSNGSVGQLSPALLVDDDFSTDDDEFDMPLLQRNPLTYFLTPATPDREELEFEFDFDAGIEDSSKPQEIVRSISPSTLDGLKRYKSDHLRGRKAVPSVDDECAIVTNDDVDDDDDGEDYIRFRPTKSFPSGLPDFGVDWRALRAAANGTSGSVSSSSASSSPERHLSPSIAFHVGSPRGRPRKKFSPPPPSTSPFLPPPSSSAPCSPSMSSRRSAMTTSSSSSPTTSLRGRSRSLPLQRRHSWREPSPDVWSIEEEPEKETLSELGLSTEELNKGGENKSLPIDIPAAKPKKRVRFVLPVKE